MKDIQELNHRMVKLNDELLVHCKELETELQGARQGSQQWADDFEELDIAYGRLEIDCDKLREERDHYKERCAYLEDELAHYEEEEAVRAADKIVEVGDMSLIISRQSGLSLELSATIAEALYDAGYKREEIV